MNECVLLILKEVEKAHEINDERRKAIRDYINLQGCAAEEIAKLMGLPLAKVQVEVDKLINSTKQVLDGAK